MTESELEAVRTRLSEENEIYMMARPWNLLVEARTLLAEIDRLRDGIKLALNDAGCPSGQGPGVLPPWTYRRLDDLLG